VSDPPLPGGYERVHLVGIGGVGMSGLARLLLRRGALVSGSDVKDSRRLAALRALGAEVRLGHDPDGIGSASVVVYSPVIPPDNIELVTARRLGRHVVDRVEALAALMTGLRGVVVAGSHGKTTTTSMLTLALQACGQDPSFVIGGDVNEAGSNAHAGSGELFVVEADESDGAFAHLRPHGLVVTNIEADRIEEPGPARRPGPAEEPDAAFRAFAERIGRDGFVVACQDDPGARRLAAALRAGEHPPRVTTYGTAPDADVRVELPMVAPSGSTCEVVARGRRLGEVAPRVPGLHNLRNAAGALAAGLELGLPAGGLIEGLDSFAGVRRRFEFKGVAGGVRVIDDYANHPTKIAAVLRTARALADGGRIVVAYQPDLYSRVAARAPAFGAALSLADAVVVMAVFGAGEEPIPGVTGAMIASEVARPAADVVYEPSWSAVAERVARLTRPGDIALTIGAGDVTLVGGEILRVLAERSALAG
jgi:UDP-N-acetylmuramate--alanine ligase